MIYGDVFSCTITKNTQFLSFLASIVFEKLLSCRFHFNIWWSKIHNMFQNEVKWVSRNTLVPRNSTNILVITLEKCCILIYSCNLFVSPSINWTVQFVYQLFEPLSITRLRNKTVQTFCISVRICSRTTVLGIPPTNSLQLSTLGHTPMFLPRRIYA